MREALGSARPGGAAAATGGWDSGRSTAGGPPGSEGVAASEAMPVAMTETRIFPSAVSSRTLPNMVKDSASTSARTRLAASSTSNRVKSGPPVMLMSTPLAPLMEALSSNGLAMARLRGLEGAPIAFGLTRSHHRLPRDRHHRLDVGEVEVDQARQDDQIGDAANGGIEDVVRHLEGVGEGSALVGDAEKVLVGDDDQGVDELLELCEAGFGDARALGTFEGEGQGDHADREDALFARHLGDDRRGAGARAAAQAGGDEDHVVGADPLADLVDRLLGGGTHDLGARPGPEAAGGGDAELNAVLGARCRERLGVGIGRQEVDSLEVRGEHVVDGIAARAADADHGDARPGSAVVAVRGSLQVENHAGPGN